MKKFKRSERIAALVRLFCSDPGRVFTLRELSGQFGCAKSTLSEDIALLRATFSERGLGIVESINGAAGGVRFYPFYDDASDALFIDELCKTLSHSSRILPGNLLFTADVLYEPKLCLLYTSDDADDLLCVDLGSRRIIKKKKNLNTLTLHLCIIIIMYHILPHYIVYSNLTYTLY